MAAKKGGRPKTRYANRTQPKGEILEQQFPRLKLKGIFVCVDGLPIRGPIDTERDAYIIASLISDFHSVNVSVRRFTN